MKEKDKKKNNKVKNKKLNLSQNAKENILIVIGLILFIIIVCFVVYIILKINNPGAFKSDEKLYEELLANMITEYNKETTQVENTEKSVNDGTFSVYVDNIYVEGKLPRMMKEKFYIECYESGIINIYSKYTYALSQTKYGVPKGIVLQIMIINNEALKDIEEDNKVFEVITKINDYSIIYIIPSEIEYIEEDDVSRSNYEKLARYRDEIIESIVARESEEGIDFIKNNITSNTVNIVDKIDNVEY